MSTTHVIAPRGGNHLFGTSPHGTTQFDVYLPSNDEEGNAHARLVFSWVDQAGKAITHKMNFFGENGDQVYMNTFFGAEVNLTNHSDSTDILVKVSADPD